MEKDKDLEKNMIEKLESKNVEELLSLERLIALFEDIRIMENTNLNFFKKTLDEVEFNNQLIIGNLGNICKSYFESYYEIMKRHNEKLKELISLMKLKSFSKSNNENEDFVILYNNDILSNNNKPTNEIFIFKDDILKIIESLSLLKEFNNEINENFENNLNEKLNELKKTEVFKELDILKEIKKEKTIFEEKLKEICKSGIDSKEFQEVKNLLLKDDSDRQKNIIWMINYFNKYRSSLSSVGQSIFNAFKELFEIVFDKLYSKKIFHHIDLTIVLLQTFSTKKDNSNYLLEEEFKEKEIFLKEDFWKNTIIQKIENLLEKINIERRDDIGSKTYINYVRENIEPILISFAFTMKDFNLSEQKTKKIIEEICHSEKYSQYKFDIEKLMVYS